MVIETKNMVPLISIIVPIYNTGKYLENCIYSILSQDYPNIEIILVDDGSTDDDTIQLSCQLAEGHKNVFLYNKSNGGSASARNYGVKVAHGKYVGFVDSDDMIEPTMFSTLYNAIEINGVKVSICGISTEKNGMVELDYGKLQSGIYDNHELMHNFLLGFWHSACTCLYDKSLVNGIMFPEGEVNEDYIFNYHVFKNLEKVSFVKTPFYHYIRREGSNTGSPQTLKFLDWINHTRFVLDDLKNNPELVQEAEYQYLYSNIVLANSSLLTLSRIDSSEAGELYDIVTNNLSKDRKMMKRNTFLKGRNRRLSYFMAHTPKLYKMAVLSPLKLRRKL